MSYNLYEYIEKEDFFNILGLDDTKFYFVNLSDSLNKENISNFLLEDTENTGELFNKNHLKEWTEWLYKQNPEGKTRLKGTSQNLGDLNTVLGNEKAIHLFRSRESSLSQALFMSEDSEDILKISLDNALENLIEADRVIAKIDDFEKIISFDETLLEIRKTAKKLFDYKKQQVQALDDEL